MNILSPVALPAAPVTRASPILAVALQLLDHLERGQRIDAAILRAAMEAAFGASDTSGAWDWKAAYEACEVATVLFLRKYGKALFRKAASPAARLSALAKIAALLPTHTRRSEESQALQQFPTQTFIRKKGNRLLIVERTGSPLGHDSLKGPGTALTWVAELFPLK